MQRAAIQSRILLGNLHEQLLSVRGPKIPQAITPAASLELGLPPRFVALDGGGAFLAFEVGEIDAVHKFG